MALAQRSAARFYAAFYRWNLQAPHSHNCVFSSLRRRSTTCYALDSSRCSYHTTRHVLQHNPNGSGSGLHHESKDSLNSSPETIHGNHKATQASRLCENQDLDTGLFTELDTDPDMTDLDPDSTNGNSGTVPMNSNTIDTNSDLDTADYNSKTAVLSASLRKLMRQVPNSVAVVTVASYDPNLNRHVPMGIAVSSFTTVSMDPPTVSFNIKEPSKTMDAIRAANGRFRVHIPTANQGGANVVEQFCQGNHPEAYSLRHRNLKLFMPMTAKDKKRTLSMAPQIWNDDVQAAIECTMTQELRVADHIIVVAKIDSIDHKNTVAPAMLYAFGQYMRLDGTAIKPHVEPTLRGVTDTLRKVWEFPRFPGDKERLQYADHIKTYIKSDPRFLEANTENFRLLSFVLPYPPAALGINLSLLIDECRREMGLSANTSSSFKDVPIASEFYGRVTPSTCQKIIERAKAIVSQDRLVLSISYSKFLQYLGANRYMVNFLPTDIIKPLRAAGLIDAVSSAGDPDVHDICRLEVIQNNIIYHFRSLPFEKALAIDWEEVMKSLGEKKRMSAFFKPSHMRLLAMAHPRHFTASRFDITGEVSQMEMRVVLRRIVYFLHPSCQAEYRRYSVLLPGEVLRRVSVDPLITGMDIEYFFAKMGHLYQSVQHFREFSPAVDRMLDAWFERTISWDDLVSRVRNFVQQHPLRATQWSNPDKIAALGLSKDATVSIPGRDTDLAPQHLNKNVILDSMFAQELKAFYGRGTDPVNQAIATYLKQNYDYIVHPKPVPAGPEDESATSDEELHKAMLAGLPVDVSAKANQGRVGRRYDSVGKKWKSYSLDGDKGLTMTTKKLNWKATCTD